MADQDDRTGRALREERRDVRGVSEETDWPQILACYDDLVALTGDPVRQDPAAVLGRAVAVGHPVPEPSPGWVLIRVKAFGLNRSELHTRLGLAEGVTFPRVPGIEAVGVVAKCPGGQFAAGQQAAALMGGMGRVFDGGYAEYTCVPAAQVVPFRSELDWAVLGAVPEMLQTAHGSLDVGLGARGSPS
ncbi:MAG TPA: alcohol dehydrogenase catalytic domain-containing protein [Streptosporangiaceae bacterium]|nr:alcohol dehydrogenase catalytic domain-containing protein [Streptosporangiaceae bacterium]